MTISIISFTKKGAELSKRIKESISDIPCELCTKCSFFTEEGKERQISVVKEPIGTWAKVRMEQRHALIFIGACGIAVRAVAPHLRGKLSDSPVLVLDEEGRYVIPILSGHMGGANALAFLLSERMGAEPVITTATDVNHQFAVDLFAKKNNLYLEQKEGIAKVSGKLLAGEEVRIAVETGHLVDSSLLPEGLQLVEYPPKEAVDILITEEKADVPADLILRPKRYVIGVGCRKGKEQEAIDCFLEETLDILGISIQQVRNLSSIDRKQEEPALVKWSEKKRVSFVTYSAEELQSTKGHFTPSLFVKSQMGVDNVCERAAMKACGKGGELIYRKRAKDGMTVAVARAEWRITFDET